jgi:hypothetical protein
LDGLYGAVDDQKFDVEGLTVKAPLLSKYFGVEKA